MNGATLLVMGGGRMGTALVTGLLDSGRAAAGELVVVEPQADRRAALGDQHPGLRLVDSAEPGLLAPGAGAILAVKPDVAEGACRLAGTAGAARVLSIVAGMSTQRLEACLPEPVPVVRAMPNTPALVGAAVSGMSGGSRVHSEDLDWAEGILSAVGTVVRLPERDLDAVTALSGSGPAYLFIMAESLIEAGVLSGLSRDVSRTLVVETLLGAAKLLRHTGQEPEALRASVTSPGGTTAAALRVLESRAVRSAYLEAVMTAAERSRQLGR